MDLFLSLTYTYTKSLGPSAKGPKRVNKSRDSWAVDPLSTASDHYTASFLFCSTIRSLLVVFVAREST